MAYLKIISYISEIHTKIFLEKVTCLGVGEGVEVQMKLDWP